MNLDPVLLARIQFAFTVGFHFIFPPISIGLAWLLVIVETLAWRKGDPLYERIGRFFARLFAITFVVGVATGITMEFQFGTNWADYARFVGDIFGAPLAAEALFAFFLESTFLGLYLAGRGRVRKGLHWFSCLMVAVGSTLSAFWILVANSWQQTPAGYVFNAETGRAELTAFWEAVFNPSTLIRFSHVINASVITGCFFMAGVAAYLLLRDRENPLARKAFRLAVLVGFVSSFMALFPFGHLHAMNVAKYQPEKLATYEGLFEGGDHAPFTIIGIPTEDGLVADIRVPGALSLLVGGSLDTVVPGRNDFPRDELPPVHIPFLTFHAMIGLGSLFIGLTALGVLLTLTGRLYTYGLYLWAMMLALPLPVLACQLGWMATEVGRQPWIVYKLLRTKDAISEAVSAGEILFSLVLFGFIYAMLGALYVFLITRNVKREALAAAEREEPAHD